MRSLSDTPATPEYHARIHPALTSFADECSPRWRALLPM
jgi:hypothetical protein